MPSRSFVDDDAKLIFHKENDRDDHYDEYGDDGRGQRRGDDASGITAHLHPDMLRNGVRNQPQRRVEFVPNGRAPPPPFLARFFSFLGRPRRNTRYEPMRMLRDAPDSTAAVRDNFVYVGQGGYFFSPYESPAMTSKLFNYFVQYMEGSLFDWQMGDLMPSCTAGDVRFYYTVQDPAVVSVLGQPSDARGVGDGEVLRITPRTMSGIGSDREAATVGLVHAGWSGARDMLLAEDSASRAQAHVVRALLALWAIPASRLAGVAFGRELGDSSFVVQAEGVFGLFFSLLGSVWLIVWGETMGGTETAVIFFMGGTLGFLSYRGAVRRGAGLHGVWCRVGKWANVPPEWRVEDSYVPSSGQKLGAGAFRAGSKQS